MNAPVVLFSPQAPNLLRRFADTGVWRLYSIHDGGNSRDPVHTCVVHSLDYYLLARNAWPNARIAWLFHSGRVGWNDNGEKPVSPEYVERILVCSYSLQALWQARYPLARVNTIVPWYRPRLDWSWCPNVVFTMLNDPQTRYQDRAQLTEATVEAAGASEHWRLFGRGQKLGELLGARRDMWVRSCSAYVDVLPDWAGFGLAHHEMFAAGVPVVGSRWGSIADEMSSCYLSLHSSPLGQEVRAANLQRLMRDENFALEMSDIGLEFIAASRTKRSMNRMIQNFLEDV